MLIIVINRRPRYELPFENDNAIVEYLVKVYDDLRQTMVQPNLGRVFSALDLTFALRGYSDWLLFDDEKLRGKVGIRELSYIGFPSDQLSRRRRTARFGWINGRGKVA
jgi:hypothetical protein